MPTLTTLYALPFSSLFSSVCRISQLPSVSSSFQDLADDRSFVSNLHAVAQGSSASLKELPTPLNPLSLNALEDLKSVASKNDRWVISGASSVPCLSSAVVDSTLSGFSSLSSIDYCISPGHKMPRGLATIASVLSYAGKAIPVWRQGRWEKQFGWMGMKAVRLDGISGNPLRLVSYCNVPDLDLFPSRYRKHGIQTVEFRAGLELYSLQLSIYLMVRSSLPSSSPFFCSAFPVSRPHRILRSLRRCCLGSVL
jgi:hypothetical protein